MPRKSTLLKLAMALKTEPEVMYLETEGWMDDLPNTNYKAKEFLRDVAACDPE